MHTSALTVRLFKYNYTWEVPSRFLSVVGFVACQLSVAWTDLAFACAVPRCQRQSSLIVRLLAD